MINKGVNIVRRGYVNGLAKRQKVILGVVCTLVVGVVAITVTGLCLGHTSPLKFVLSWFGK